jgi:hypothetical protein
MSHGNSERNRVLKELEARRSDIEAKLEKAEAEIKDAVQRTADSLLSSADVGDDTRVTAAGHPAEAARVALPGLLKKLERAQARVKRLAERENEFLRAALGDRYMKALAECVTSSGWSLGSTGYMVKVRSSESMSHSLSRC